MYDSVEKALTAGAEMQDSMEAEWQINYAEHHHDSSLSSQVSLNFITIKYNII